MTCSFFSVVFTFLIIRWFKLFRWYNDHETLEGSHIMVTGGSSGIGKFMAVEAVKRGANVTIIARDKIKLKNAQVEIEKCCVSTKQRVEYISLDISQNYEYIRRTINEAERDLGPVHMLVNCAGMALCGKLEDMHIEEVYHLMNLNYMGTLHMTKALIGNMKTRRKGYIVITGSQAALFGIFGYSVYSSTKYALRGLAEALQMETKPYGISVTLGLPPDTDTPGFENEEKSKPLETKLISEAGGLYKPEVVAEQLMKDVLNKKFFSTVGFEGNILTALSCGMTPVTTLSELFFQVFFMGLFRLISVFYRISFDNIIKNCMLKDAHEKQPSDAL